MTKAKAKTKATTKTKTQPTPVCEKPLTMRQREILLNLDKVHAEYQTGRGRKPTTPLLASQSGLTVPGAEYHLLLLKKRGYVARDGTLLLTEKGKKEVAVAEPPGGLPVPGEPPSFAMESKIWTMTVDLGDGESKSVPTREYRIGDIRASMNQVAERRRLRDALRFCLRALREKDATMQEAALLLGENVLEDRKAMSVPREPGKPEEDQS